MKSLFRLLAWRRETGTRPPAPDPKELQQGRQLEDQGDYAGARELYEKAAAVSPQLAKAHLYLGNASFALGRTSEAISCYRRAIELQPDSFNAYVNLGAALLSRQSVAQAEESYRNAVRLRQDSADAWAGLGCALEMRSAPEGAIEAFGRALENDPAHEGAASRLAQSLRERGQAHAALKILESALQINPASVVMLRVQGDIQAGIGEYAAAIAAYRGILAQNPQDWSAYDSLLWTLNFVPQIGPEEILAEHRRFGDALERTVARLSPSAPPDPHRRLRIGYVSPDFRRHSVSCFMEPLLRNHDRTAVEVHCFYDFPVWDEVTERIYKSADRWHEISGMADEAVAAKILADEIDILVDLAGHSAHNRLRLFALKPAPVQFTWLGYLCTTGLRAVDYRLCDFHTDPEGVAERWQVEHPARLPDSQWCYLPQVALPELSPLPRLVKDYWTFGSFNQESKLSDTILEAWCRVLAGIPDSRIRIVGISCDRVEDRIRDCFSAHGIAVERVELLGRIPIEEYFVHYRGVDIALDSFPYNGATTTCDALIMGVPVATIAGKRAIERGGVSLLTTLGLSDWNAESPEALVEVLRAQTAQPQRLVALRHDLPQRMRASALMDGRRFAGNVETIFRAAWERTRSPRPGAAAVNS